jgi:glycosyltransferase involved in cell wall biosynthesis
MHAALLADSEWLDTEPATFKALEVGLLDEQVRVTQVVPEGVADLPVSMFSARLTWRESRLVLLRDWRLTRLAGALQRSGVDRVHALDARLWSAGAGLARRMGVPVVLSCSSIQDVRRVPQVLHALAGVPAGFTATTQPIADALRQAAGAEVLIERIPPGVHVPDQPVTLRRDPEAPCLVISGTGRLDAGYDAVFAALRLYVETRPQAQFFLEARGSDQHGLWKAARRLGLLTHINLVPPQVSRHQVLLQADAVIQPQASGRSRSFTLNAMAQGIPVLALADPVIDYLIDKQTAWVIEVPEQHRWTARLAQLDADVRGVESLIASARAWCSKRHLVSHRVNQVLSLYRKLGEH